MKFDTSSEAHEFIENVFPRIGARNKAIVGRSALLLALGEGVPSEFKPKDSKGVTLNDEQVLGDDLRDLVRAALNHRLGSKLDDPGYRSAFKLYFEYGCHRLRQLWTLSGNDQAHFVAALLKLSESTQVLTDTPIPTVRPMPVVENEVRLKVLTDAPDWSLNGPGTSNGLLVISGQPGSGKSQLALDLLCQLTNRGVRFAFFDMKGELEGDSQDAQQRKNRSRFLEQTGAQYVRLIQQGLPINPLYRHANATQNAQVSYEIASLIRCFAPQLGAIQERNICDAYQRLDAPDFASLAFELESSGARGVDLSIVQKIDRFHLFANADDAVAPEDWLANSMVVDFKDFGIDTDTKALAVALILNFLIKRLNQQLAPKGGIQPLKMVLFVDEAHLLLPKEGKAGLLSSLARQGRSWGFPVWLASQDADKFLSVGAGETNFAELAECGVHFSPQTLNDSQQRQILGKVVRQQLARAEGVLCTRGRMQTIGTARQFWRDLGR